MANVKIVSMGPGGIDLLTWEAVQELYKADILIGSEKFLELYPEQNIQVPENLLQGTINLIKKHKGKRIAIMVTGDAGFYSLGKSIVKEFGRDNVDVIPGVSIVQFAFAKICEPWQEAKLLSVHGRDTDVLDKVEDNDRFLILCDNKNCASDMIKKIEQCIDTHEMFIMEDLGMEDEKITEIKELSDTSKLNESSIAVITGVRRQNA